MDAASTNELAAAHKRRREQSEAEVAVERGVVGIGDGSGRTWHGGPPVNDHMWVRPGAGFEADGVTPTTAHLARNLSLHEFAEGDPVTLEWMSSARGANMLQIVYREQGCPPAYTLTRHIARKYGVEAYGDESGPFGVDALLSEFGAFELARDQTETGYLYVDDDRLIRRINGATNIIEHFAGSQLAGSGSFGPGVVDGPGTVHLYHATGPRIGGGTVTGYPDTVGIFRTDAATGDGIHSLTAAPDGSAVYFIAARNPEFMWLCAVGTGIGSGANLFVIAWSLPDPEETLRDVHPGFAGDGGPSSHAKWRIGPPDYGVGPQYLAVHPTTGALYVYDQGNAVIRSIALPHNGQGVVTSVTGSPDHLTDSDAGWLTFSPNGVLYFYNGKGEIVRWLGGALSIVAGNRDSLTGMTAMGEAFDGCVAADTFITPFGLCADASENLYVLVTDGIVKIMPGIGGATARARSLIRRATVAADSNSDALTKPASGAHVGLFGMNTGLHIDSAGNLYYSTNPFVSPESFDIIVRAEP